MANNTVYANNVAGTLAAGVGPSDTILLLGAGQGASFPSPSGGDWFWLTCVHQASGAIEVMQCTARSVDSLTVVRGRDGTTAISMITGSVVEMRLCAIMMREVDYRTVKGVANGLATLDGSGLIPDAQIPADIARDAEVAATYIPLSQRAAANGVATLDASTLIPAAQIPDLFLKLASGGTVNGGITAVQTIISGTTSGELRVGGQGPGAQSTIFKYDGTMSLATGGAPAGFSTIWHSSNFNPAGKLNVASPTSTGTLNHTGNAVIVGNLTLQTGDLTLYRPGGTTAAIFMNSAGDRYIHWDGTYYQFNAAACRGPNFIATSDRRQKTRIRRHKVKRGVADAIQLHDWEWKRSTTIKGGGSGVIAQQVLDYAPHHVQGGDSLGVDKAGLALEGVVDLAARMRELEKVIHGSANNRPRSDVSRPRRTARK